MQYENELVFAERTCEIYFRTKECCKDFQYTHALGCLLNLLSTIRPDRSFIIDVSSVIPEKSREEIENFLTVIRDSMAHHIKKNFLRNSIEGQISSVKFGHHGGKDFTEEMTIEQLDKIIGILYGLVKKKLTD